MNYPVPIQVDPAGFVWYDGVKLPIRFIPARRSIEFFDKDKRRSEKRGSRTFEIPIDQFSAELLEKAKEVETRPVRLQSFLDLETKNPYNDLDDKS